MLDVFDDGPEESDWRDNQKEAVRRYKKNAANKAQDLYLAYQEQFDNGPMNPERRAACEFDPLLFGQTYFPEDFYLPFSPQHKIEAEKLKQAVLKKSSFANADRRGGGKAEWVNSVIPVPSGWSTMGEIQPGDFVFDKDGNQCRVNWKTPVFVPEKCYDVEFADGSIIKACADHQWYVKKDSWKPRNAYRVVTTQFLFDAGVSDYFGTSHVRHQFVVPAAKAIQCDDVELPIDPYTLGVWLANGDSSSTVACAVSHIADVDEIASYCDHADVTMPEAWVGVENKKEIKFRSFFMSDMKRLNLYGNKHIPAIYLRASESQRRSLLQGFCDCDGHIAERSRVRIELKQDQLAHDVVELIRSLGIKVDPKWDLYRDKSHDDRFKKDIYGPYVKMNFRAFKEEPVFRLKRKADLQLPGLKNSTSKTNAIVDIRPVPSVPMCCIEVDSPSHTYLTGNQFTVTHNSTRARMFVVWGVAYGHVKFPLLITATSKSAERNREAIVKKFMYSQQLIEDFPELCLPFLFCRGKGQSANHMLWKGNPAECKAAVDRLVIPQMDLEYSRCTQSVLQFTSMEGEIRGNSHSLPNGGTVRPDLAICDDPQTRKTAKSKTESESLEDTIKSDVAYCNGPDKRIGIVVPCTVIYKGDLADRLLDRKLNPQFHGERTQFMISFPKNMEWWERYGDMRAEMQMNDRPEEEIDAACNDLYKRERDIADEGAVVSWDFAFTDNEVSAIQHGMNRWLSSPSAFSAEYQNNPASETENDAIVLESRVVARRYSGYQKNVLPDWTQILVASIDISESVLWWELQAFSMDFTAASVSYGTFPDQRRRYVTLSGVQKSMQEYWTEKLGHAVGIGAAYKLSLETMFKMFATTEWKTQSGRSIPCGAIMVDIGYKEPRPVVMELAKLPEYKGLVHPCKGMPTTADRPSIWNPQSKPKQGERRGHAWRQVQMEDGPQTQFDANSWKTTVARALLTSPGDPGALTVYTVDKVSSHEMWADQKTVETADKIHSQKTDVTMIVWNSPPGADNHFTDTGVLGFVGASKLGATKVGHRETAPAQSKVRRRKSLRELYEKNSGETA